MRPSTFRPATAGQIPVLTVEGVPDVQLGVLQAEWPTLVDPPIVFYPEGAVEWVTVTPSVDSLSLSVSEIATPSRLDLQVYSGVDAQGIPASVQPDAAYGCYRSEGSCDSPVRIGGLGAGFELDVSEFHDKYLVLQVEWPTSPDSNLPVARVSWGIHVG
jgi:hypothetical protein